MPRQRRDKVPRSHNRKGDPEQKPEAVITDWALVDWLGGKVLIGLCTSHPARRELENKRLRTTRVIDMKDGVAETFNAFYRLEKPASGGEGVWTKES